MMGKIRIKTLIAVFLSLFCLAALWGFLIEPNLVITERIIIDNAPDFLKDQKMVQISDLHLREFGYREKKVLKILDNLNPDFIFITGDIVDWSTANLQVLEQFLQGLPAGCKNRIFAVWGNHDHRNNKFRAIKNILAENGIIVLNNESEKINIGENSFYLIGVDDPHSYYDDVESATAGVPDDSYNILLAHSPEIFRKLAGRDIDLALAGHTHGCQAGLPFICDLFLPVDYDKKYKKGLFWENSTYLYINRGIGLTFMPFRMNSLPEVTLINFKQK